MAYDLEEQETLANAKAWWKTHGNWITWVVIIALACYAAYSFWGYYQRRQAAQASGLYYEMQRAVMANDLTRVQLVAKDTQDKYGGTVYAPMVSLVAAKMAFEGGHVDEAKANLKWIVDNGKQDGYVAMAKIRLAGILLDEQQYEEGLKLVSGTFPEGYVSLAADRKGDFLVALNRLSEAKAAYQTAFDKASADDPGKALVRIKLEEIGAPIGQQG